MSILPVKVVTDADLEENGGVYLVQKGIPAVPVWGFTEQGNMAVSSKALAVYVVTEAEFNAGDFVKAHGQPMRVIENVGKVVEGREAIPVWAANDWPSAGAVPNAPTNLIATAVSASQIGLFWTDNSGDETGFNIYRDNVLIDTVAADATSYQDTGLTSNTLYEYYVTAVNAEGESAPSNTDSATTGTEFYVDATAGNDANDGLTTLTAWQTLAKVNSLLFDTGDMVLLKRGEIWNEMLTVPSDGITIGAYGAGALPIIHGQDTRNYCINASARNNLTVEDLTLQDPLLTGLLFTSGTHTVNRVVSDGSNDQAFQSGGGLIDSNVTFNDCVASGAFDDGFSVHPGPGLNYLLTINNCTVTGCNEGLQDAGASAGTIAINDSTFNANVKDITISTFITLTVNRTMFKGMAGASHQSITGLGTINYSIFDMADSARATQVAASGAGAVLALNNCTFYGWNGSQTNGGLIAGNGATLNAVNCIFDRAWRIIRGGTGVANLDYCNLNGVTTVDVTTNTNSVAGNPLLTNPAADDFTLSAGSPAIGAGTTYVGQLAMDYAGNPVASPPSLGALEYIP